VGEAFGRIARSIAQWTGSPIAFLGAVLIIVGWAVAGPVFGFSDTWQLVINTSTTIVTFLMVFLIQNTQNRDSMALQLKLDELIHAMSGARDEMIDLEEEPEERLVQERERFRHVASALGEASTETAEAAEAIDDAVEARETKPEGRTSGAGPSR